MTKAARYLLPISLLAVLLSGCATTQYFTKSDLKKLDKMVTSPAAFQSGFTGFALFDPENGKFLYQHNAGKYFTPASNAKLFTYYTCLQTLGDSIAGLRYVVTGDSLIFWGTGDPSFLNPHLGANRRIFDFLRSRPEKLFFCPHNFADEHFGKGWMWDDYNEYYQAEKAPFPIFGNVVVFQRPEAQRFLTIRPAIFYAFAKLEENMGGEQPAVVRELDKNEFRYNPQALSGEAFEREAPFRYSPEFFAELLSDTLRKPVAVFPLKVTPPADSKVLYSVPADSLYRLLLQDSDNFVAEQLLLNSSDAVLGSLSVEKIIEWAGDSLLRFLPDSLRWFDGSGLSRYNLSTPRNLALLLHKIYQTTPRERLFSSFPAGGISGTIKGWYAGNPAYVFAKTGSMSNVHCLSGFVKTANGKVLIFSFMHNAFTIPGKDLKQEMQRLLQWVRDGR